MLNKDAEEKVGSRGEIIEQKCETTAELLYLYTDTNTHACTLASYVHEKDKREIYDEV